LLAQADETSDEFFSTGMSCHRFVVPFSRSVRALTRHELAPQVPTRCEGAVAAPLLLGAMSGAAPGRWIRVARTR
jgi:hypothetical protein